MIKELSRLLTSINDHLAAIRKIAETRQKNDLDELAEALYPKLKKLAVWGH